MQTSLARELYEVALAAVEPAAATEAALCRAGVDAATVAASGVFALGKAAPGMLAGLCRVARPAWALGVGQQACRVAGFPVLAGDHPVPGLRSLTAGEAVRQRALAATGPVISLISGGASALVELPVAGVTLAQLQEETTALLRGGAPIEALNAHRAGRSQLKGGGLRRLLGAHPVYTVVISDVFGPPSLVGSGPTLSPGDEAVIAADNATAVQAMACHARDRGLSVVVYPEPLRGEAREVGPRWLQWARSQGVQVALAGGETTVTVRGSGRGGRNLELALSCVELLDAEELIFAGTDGIDGTSDAAGAHLTLEWAARADAGDVASALANNDAHGFFSVTGGLLHTGPTNTNVADVAIWAGIADCATTA